MKLSKMELNKIYCGDCLELIKEIDDNSIDLVITSPPYDNLRDYNGYNFDFESVAKELFRVTKEGGVVVWVVGDATIDGSETGTSFRQSLYFLNLGFYLHDTMIYQKKKAPLTHNRYEQEFEYMFVFSKGRPKTFNPIMIEKSYKDNRIVKGFGRRDNGDNIDLGYASKNKLKIRGNVWFYKVGGGHVTKDKIAYKHPAIFPEQLAEDHILSWSNEGDLVLDPMCGSGTTLKMAFLNKRKFIGFDISQEYCNISNKRLGDLSKKG